MERDGAAVGAREDALGNHHVKVHEVLQRRIETLDERHRARLAVQAACLRCLLYQRAISSTKVRPHAVSAAWRNASTRRT